MVQSVRPTRSPPASAPPVRSAGTAHPERDAELARLLAGAAAGQADDFERFYDRTVGYARALARRIVAADDIDDALADAYLDAWRHAGRYDPSRASAVTWLLTLVHSRAIDLRRRRGAVQASIDDDHLAAEGGEPGERLWQAEAGERLHAALGALSPHEHWVLGLAYFRDLTHTAIAQATGFPLGTVKSLILRGQAKLRHELGSLA